MVFDSARTIERPDIWPIPPRRPSNNPRTRQPRQQQAATFEPNCWVTIRRDGTTVIESSHSEQGQGILTGIMSAIVDEADSDWDKVEIYEAGLSSEAPYISHSITGGFTMMDDLARFRHAGATVRTHDENGRGQHLEGAGRRDRDAQRRRES